MMNSEEISDLLTIPDKRASLLGFGTDLDLDLDSYIDSMNREGAVPKPASPKWPVPAQPDISQAGTPMEEFDFEFDSGEDDQSTTLSKRQDPGARKKRLKGQGLISYLKANPMFRDHEELFQESLDDLSRKKMMQKIRNRISAQESRDRKKNQFSEISDKNFVLEKENVSLKAEIDSLRKENRELKRRLEEITSKPGGQKSGSNSTKHESDSTNVEQSSCGNSEVLGELHQDEDSSVLGRLLRRKDSGESRLGWKPFILIVMAVCLAVVFNPLDSPTTDSSVKSSAMVPLIGSKYSGTPSHKALMKLEQVCDKYCSSKYEKECLRNTEARHRAVRDELLSLGSDAVLRTTPLDIVIRPETERSVVLQQARPFSTLVCNSVIDLDQHTQNTGDDQWIHFVYPKKDTIVGGDTHDQHSEYEGILAKVVSRTDIRVHEGTHLIPQTR